MKSHLKYFLLSLFLPVVTLSQTDTISDYTLQNFHFNLLKSDNYSQNLRDNQLEISKISDDTLFNQQFAQWSTGAFFSEELALSKQFFAVFTGLKPSEKQLLMVRFSQYENQIEEILEEKGLPTALKYLAPALSAMNPKAVGPGKRAGLWQLTHFQGIFNGLEINRLVDERFNVYKATQAFSEQIKKNIELFGSEENALLSYLAGTAAFRNAILKAGRENSNTELLTLLPDYVSETLAAYQAMAVFIKNNNVNLPEPAEKPDTVLIDGELHLQQISGVLNIPLKKLRTLNPQYIYAIVPGNMHRYTLFLPSGRKEEYDMWQDSIIAAFDSALFDVVAQKIEYPPAPSRQYTGEKVKDLEIEGKTKIKYTIKTGDVLGFIAEDFNVRVADLKYWNNIYNERKIRAGATLQIFVDNDEADYYRNLYPEPTAQKASNTRTYPIPESAKKIEHIVKSGESPYVIAKKYDGVTPEAILYWNGISDARKIQIGQKLIIYYTR